MENVILHRVFDFLNQYPPFSLLERSVLMEIAEKVRIKYFPAERRIFSQGESTIPFIYMVREGAVQLFRVEEAGNILVDQCDEGDVFGIRPLLAEQPYALTAMTVEESLIYAISTEGLRPIIENNPKIAWYFAQNFAAGIRNKFAYHNKGRIFTSPEALKKVTEPLTEITSINYSKAPVTCNLTTSVKKAAKIMRRKKVGSIIVVSKEKYPLGILTDRDLRNKVVAGDYSIELPVSGIMSSPVFTVRPQLAVADVQIAMIRQKIHHLCLTEDGTINSKIVGVISEHDLLVVQGNNPAVLIRELSRSQSGKGLRKIRERAEKLLAEYLGQEVSIDYIAGIMTEVNDALISRAIELSIKKLEKEKKSMPKVRWCWLGLGSEGRGEQLLRTDQDNALVFEDVPEKNYLKIKNYFGDLSSKVTATLYEAGFAYCPGDMMASNPQWCKSLEEWKKQFSEWITQPSAENILYSSIFFDYRSIYGDRQLTEQLSEHIFNGIEQQNLFLSFLAKGALQNPPPLTFFRNFMVERSGEHKDKFDIKSRAMRPLADVARCLILKAKVPGINSTFRRFQKLAELEEQNRELYTQAADAYEILVRYRALQGLKNHNKGRYFRPSELTKMERMNLRNTFEPIRELQQILYIKFRLAYLM
ncbi:MAG: hypothetical protein DHS20C18_03990 [Saprospiraceae bacterium]|nr:MAG: hypothetical protein DHS20C18_03990 [Saprospiraceae bacterium]